ncbi:MAG: response regulator transcription factor [Deltaproteobacteria bacterium]|nr:response regulator transcription factor [Candidatus Anaeroferrophillus wilburensis]
MANYNHRISKPVKYKVFIVEDHPIFSMGMSELINQEEDLEVCGDADNIASALKAIDLLHPDLIIVDLALKGCQGIDLIKEVEKSKSGIPMLVLSMHDEAIHAERCIIAGARGYIMKQEASESVIDALKHILAGNIYVSSKIMNKMVGKLTGKPGAAEISATNCLTDRELEVLTLIGKGLSASEIAEHLHVSPKTIGTYRERLKEKLELKHGAELVRYAVLWVEFRMPL